MEPIYVAVVLVGAVARLTRLVTWDKITEPFRTGLLNLVLFDREQRAARHAGTALPAPASRKAALTRLRMHRWLRTLITCAWCAGLWISAAAVATIQIVGPSPWVMVPASALALSYAVGLLSGLEADRRPSTQREQPGPLAE